jgi:capsid protein
MARRRNSLRLQSPSAIDGMEGMRSDYLAARDDRLRRRREGYSASGSGADYHYRRESDWLKLIEYARDFVRNDAVIGQAVERAVTETVQLGFSPNPNTGDKDKDRELSLRWRDWAEDPQSCDAAGERTWHDLECDSLRATFVEGDVLHVGLDPDGGREGAIETYEAHRLRTPQRNRRDAIVHGVELSARRERIRYWITDEPVDGSEFSGLKRDFIARDAFDSRGVRRCFHVYNPKRTSQTRGITAFAPIFGTACGFEDLNEYKIVQALMVSMITLFRERSSMVTPPTTTPAMGSTTSEPQGDGTTRQIEEWAPGAVITGAPGEKLVPWSPNVPNPEFFEHAKMLLTLIGVNLGLPLVLVLMDASQTNFSGWRGAVDGARRGFRRNQRMLVNRLHRPAYIWKVREWMDAKKVRGGDELLRHTWHTPTWPYIQPEQEAKADALRIAERLSSSRRVLAERGLDWDEIAAEIVEDQALLARLAIEKADELNRTYPSAGITWRELARWPKAQDYLEVLAETEARQAADGSQANAVVARKRGRRR